MSPPDSINALSSVRLRSLLSPFLTVKKITPRKKLAELRWPGRTLPRSTTVICHYYQHRLAEYRRILISGTTQLLSPYPPTIHYYLLRRRLLGTMILPSSIQIYSLHRIRLDFIPLMDLIKLFLCPIQDF
jgi:hypothetical protein